MIEHFKPYKLRTERKHKMNESTKLKDVIHNEMNKVTYMLISSGTGDKITLTKWLQSLQRINNVCKNRNRY